jgi:putative CRISPR-associated protein (TIGR02619 family)
VRTGICTVGTSLLFNWRKTTGGGGEPDRSDLVAFLNQHHSIEASAETNTLHRLIESKTLAPGHRLVFLHSATVEGELCSQALRHFYTGHGYSAETREISGLNYKHRDFANKGLTSLVDILIELVGAYSTESTDTPVILVATGGFKAELAYVTISGALLGVPVYYIHERFDGLVEMPVLPISIDYAYVAEYIELFEKLNEMPTRKEWDTFLLQWQRETGGVFPKRLSRFTIQEDGLFYLSPAGDLLYKAFQERLAHVTDRRVNLSPQAKKALDALEGNGRERVERLLAHLLISEVRAVAGSKKNSDLRAHPRGNKAERILFYEEDGDLYVCEICSHSDLSYERLLDAGVWRQDYEGTGFHKYELP